MEDAIEARRAEQRENSQRLRAESRYWRLFESIDEGFFIIEKVEPLVSEPLDFRFVEANPAFAVQSGVRGVVGRTMREVFPGEAEEWYSTFDDVLATGKSIRFEHELVTQARVLELYAFCLDDGIQSRIAVIFKDISQHKAAQEALRDANRRKDEFLAMLAHELRNPLASISNALTIMAMASNRARVAGTHRRRA